MEIMQKARILAESGQYDSCGPRMCEVKIQEGLGGIYNAKSEHKSCHLFKTLMTNSCAYDCKYCENARGCAKQKVSYSPDELAKVFNHLYTNKIAEGLFLSSGIEAGNPDVCTERMLEAVHILRDQYKCGGYVHFKILPGTSYELVKQASEIATRMSINLEAPSKGILDELSSCKDYKIDILRRQSWISKFDLKSGQTTQMIVNNLASDKDVLRMTEWEYNSLNMKRVYYSAFRPVRGTELEHVRAEPLSRQNKLYNADFLLRDYGYKTSEIFSIMDDGMLPKEDPKLAIAKATFSGPVDLNEASYEELIRVPGIGPKTASRILDFGYIRSYSQLNMLGATIDRAKPFIEIEGKRQMRLAEFCS
ncbi:MAG: helix-hairpin-helix domain-containing protein [Candidatus Woesearchaeota archaeon]